MTIRAASLEDFTMGDDEQRSPAVDVPAQQQLQVQVSEPHADVLYSDQAFISYTPVGFTLDFAQLTPQIGLSRIVSRVGMSPIHLKLLVQVLSQNLQKYEEQFGVVQITHQMVEQHSPPHQHIGFKPDDKHPA
jgi:hypothetical protein